MDTKLCRHRCGLPIVYVMGRWLHVKGAGQFTAHCPPRTTLAQPFPNADPEGSAAERVHFELRELQHTVRSVGYDFSVSAMMQTFCEAVAEHATEGLPVPVCVQCGRGCQLRHDRMVYGCDCYAGWKYIHPAARPLVPEHSPATLDEVADVLEAAFES